MILRACKCGFRALAIFALALGAASCASAVAGPLLTPTPVYIPPVPTVPPTPTSRPEREASAVSAAWPTSTFLDGTHRDAGLTCGDCHLQEPPKAAPVQDTCLKCHGGSWDALSAKTAGIKPNNPHASHLGAIGCENCHQAHGPFVYYCASCHNAMSYTGKLK